MSLSIWSAILFRFALPLMLGLLFIATGCREADSFKERPDNTLLLISLDGFGHDYLNKAITPIFDSIIENGVKAEALIPVFPTKTFPNHYSQVTGLYPENHGIISNRMYDPQFQEFFSIGAGSTSARDGKWYQGEPIWVTAAKQGLTTATMFWPGSDAEINGYRPDHYIPFNGAISEHARVRQVLEWISLDANRPHLITIYFEKPDQIGHARGPNSLAMDQAIQEMDQLLEELMEGIIALGLRNFINIVIVSDHGMAPVSRDKVVFLDDYIDLDDVEVINWSPFTELIPKPGKEELIYKQLVNSHPNFQVYRKGSIPAGFHYQQHPRITPIVGLADLGWSIGSRNFFELNPEAYLGGAHGYDPFETSMGGIFMASGPAFKPGITIPELESVHLYELMCHILQIVPADNDGDLEVWTAVLQ